MTALLASANIPRMKSPEAFRTISEVSAELDVPQHVLRFWESRFTQIKPVKRAGGRRYYRPEDVDLLRGIRTLLYSEGFTIKGVQKVLRDKGMRHVTLIGRGEAKFSGPRDSEPPEEIPAIETAGEPRFARAALATLERLHSEPAALDEAATARLEILLGELLQLKTRLRSALSRT
jgi:DNA-binding transcriptional MerR regulator